ncbi:glyoxylase-like metal-dependent hydrolase (beta-lactamase superfamily II) [Rhodovulum bhavnagarense]|uniref:Glyoxylase-like metal-dependent hydrolase (Beta-lactamase superfamily II) n=1 Tax=Rhodovulum bhavnagarense TaxID=992286 RepID=A0A4R2RCQ7_9RHOB|nr:MBL fold metallo-hydrolase [Rhodovulum bhavnagarense]TCP59757.1 glyoxylase-like metal-dependent hydrolase (beta-lactamase superfamily II) [Rhodovulum bhavnagarense]
MSFDPTPGQAETLAPGLRRVLAPNPSPMTYRGTNTYILGRGAVAVIDPGPDDRAHFKAIFDALAPNERITHILVTHSHVDHSPLARPLSRATGAPVLAHGDSTAGRRADLAQLSGLGGGEGIDPGFAPDHRLADGETIIGADWQITALHTPGHMGNHMCFAWQGALFTGDHVMGWASSMVSPPDGDLAAFMASLDRLRARPEHILYPGHGAPVQDGPARIAALATHRRARRAQILEALARGPATPEALTRAIYTDAPPGLLGAALRNVLAHLVELTDEKLAAPLGEMTVTTPWQRI